MTNEYTTNPWQNKFETMQRAIHYRIDKQLVTISNWEIGQILNHLLILRLLSNITGIMSSKFIIIGLKSSTTSLKFRSISVRVECTGGNKDFDCSKIGRDVEDTL